MLDLIMSYLAKAIAECLELIVGFLMPVFGFDFDTFASAFPFAATAYYIFQRVALAIALIVGVYHLIQFLMTWFGIRTDQLKSTPIRELGQVILSVIFIYYGNYILSAIIDIAQLPFNALLNTNVETSWNPLEFDIGKVVATLNDYFYQYSVLLYIILLLLIGFSLIKVVLEAVERYIILYVLVYLSPLAAASLASEETSGIYKKFFSMFISQCLLLLLNIWSLKMSISMLSNLSQNSAPVLGLLMGYGFLRVAQKMDSYLNQLGLNAAITGSGLGAELFATGSMIMGKLSGAGGSKSGANPTEGGKSGILGFGRAFSGMYSNVHPLSYVSKKVSGIVGDKVGGIAQAGAAWGADADNSPWNVPVAKAGAKIGSAIQSGVQRVKGGFGAASFSDSSGYSDFSAGGVSGSSGDFSTEGFHAIGSNPQAAVKAFNTFQGSDQTTYEPQEVGAVLNGMGAGKADPALKKYIDAASGKMPASNVSFSMGPEGITGRYDADGHQNNLSVVSAGQHAAMTDDQKIGYQRLKAKTGDTFYYRAGRQKL